MNMDGTIEVEKDTAEPQFTLAHQKVELDINFSQNVTGKTEITIYPESKDLRFIRLNARQCSVSNILINGLAPGPTTHHDPCDDLTLHFDNSNVHHHHLLSERTDSTQRAVPVPNLIISLPKGLKIKEVDIAEVHTDNAGTIEIPNTETEGAETIKTAQALSDTTIAKYTPLTVSIEFSTLHLRESVQFVTGKRGTGRWPHAYTSGHAGGASASALFPCIDSLHARCSWDITITSPRTVGDAITQTLSTDLARLTLEEKTQERAAYENKEMTIICSGKAGDETINKHDTTKKTAFFSSSEQLSAKQIGFAVGPFEKVNLNVFRDASEVEKLLGKAVNILGYCLPGRSEEVKNTCLATAKAIDTFSAKYCPCQFQTFSMLFVEDLHQDVSIFAGTAMCSTRLLYAEDVFDPAQENTRKLVHAIASQWCGINIIPEAPADTWVTIAIAQYMTDLFMRDLCGNNEYRYRIKQRADRIHEIDRERPSMYDMGNHLHVDPSLHDFLVLKAPIVLFILDRRMHKTAGASKMPGIIAKILTRARTGELLNNTISTDYFIKTVERFFHATIKDFADQWIYGAGSPHFKAFQRFNKKKLVVEMTIQQVLPDASAKELDPKNFLRDVREDWGEVYSAEPQNVFTGPMTIRIHEAEGTPYEHIVNIKDAKTVIEVPYNTKYKRLKRSKKQKDKPNSKAQATEGEEEASALLYCLGDVLQGEDEVRDWKITEWSADDEERMSAESYEWIRLDADFEWIAKIELQMPGYMFTSQAQQDRDVVAQIEAIKAIGVYAAQPLVSSILIRTLMDRRYFHGVRYLAAQGLVRHATDEGTANWIGLYHLKKAFEELFCLTTDQGSSMTRPNDFSDQQSYMVQIAILEAISKIRNQSNHTPREVKEFLLDKLKFNDNSNNFYSDAFYISKLMHALTNAIIARRLQPSSTDDDEDIDMDLTTANELSTNRTLEAATLEEIDRYRRMDEWTSSYQNLYSRSALECQAKLLHAGIATFSPLHFLQYTRPGNYELLRGVSYEILVQPSLLQNNRQSVLRYICHCMVGDSSPWIRERLQEAFGRVLAKRAIGIHQADVATANANANETSGAGEGLVIEMQDIADVDALQVGKQRRQSVEVALEALKKEVKDHEVLKTALWKAVCYGDITLRDLVVMLDFCRMLYPPKDELKVTLRYPRYYRLQNLGKVRFIYRL